MKKPRKWCKHIGVMQLKTPIHRFVNGKQMATTNWFKWEYWYFLKTTHAQCDDFEFCPYCGAKKPNNPTNTGA